VSSTSVKNEITTVSEYDEVRGRGEAGTVFFLFFTASKRTATAAPTKASPMTTRVELRDCLLSFSQWANSTQDHA
jgi:hypothetical protein